MVFEQWYTDLISDKGNNICVGKMLEEDIQNLVDAAMQALVSQNTEAIKGILRQGSYEDYIFPSVADGSVLLSARNLFLRVNAILPANCTGPLWCLEYDNALGNILLHRATYISDYELIRLLLEKGADVTSPNAEGKTALHIACEKASLEIVKFLTKKSPAYILNLPDIYEYTPLDYACEFNCPDVVQFLLAQGSSVGAEDDKRKPVFCALLNDVAEYATPIASMLLDAGANVNVNDHQVGTPLIYALAKSIYRMEPPENSITSQNYPYVDFCMLLIDHGSDVNAANSFGQTALHLAVQAGFETVVRKLLISGSNIEKCDTLGDTPLHYACKKGNQKLVDLLIICGANLHALDRETTLERWRRWGNLNERNIQLLNYAISQSRQCLDLESLCYITIRKSIRNVETDASHLGLPPLLEKRLGLRLM